MGTINCPKCKAEIPSYSGRCPECDWLIREGDPAESPAPMNRADWASEIGRVESQIATLENDARRHDRQASDADRSRIFGAIGALLGLVLLFVIWWLGLLLLIAGALAYVTQALKAKGERDASDLSRDEIVRKRGKLAKLRALA